MLITSVKFLLSKDVHSNNVSCTGAGHAACEEKRTSSSKGGGSCVEIGAL